MCSLISFGRNTHSGTSVEETCPYVFGVPGCCGGMAHGFSPEDGRAHFNEDETFTHGTSNGINLLWVAAHIFGHNLGMEHTIYEGAIMYPYYPGYVPNLHLHSDDCMDRDSIFVWGGKFTAYLFTAESGDEDPWLFYCWLRNINEALFDAFHSSRLIAI